MHRLVGCVAAALLFGTGCTSICPGPFDWDYLATGGVWERADPTFGSVASLATPEASVQQRRVSSADVPHTPMVPDARRERQPITPPEWSPGDPMLDLPPEPPQDQDPVQPPPTPPRDRIETWAPRASQVR